MNARDPHSLSLASRIAEGAYQAYSYSYPHKSAYRPLQAPVSLKQAWSTENRSALFAYVHLPFCTMRCGFCNLFAMAKPLAELVDRYVGALVTQMEVMDDVLGERRFARLALGGGTPSYLDAGQLAKVYDAAQRCLKIDLAATPSGIEVSPETVTRDRLAVCRQAGVDRVSMGVQSFVDEEMRALARPQQNTVVAQAIDEIRRAGFPTMNLDLIYGIAGQTLESWLASVDSALAFQPEEIYLYPLYVRQQTGLGRLAIRLVDRQPVPREDARSTLYAAARDRLLEAGYTQVSMRMFRAPHAPADEGPAYCCQSDGMVGLGAGARSYTARLHYSSRYAVDRAGTRDIIESFVASPRESFAFAQYGFELSPDEQRRRFVIQSLLTFPGLDHVGYQARFGHRSTDDLPQLSELLALGLAHDDGRLLALNDNGMAMADVIGPWLGSDEVHRLSREARC